ncbi:flagellar hook-associated protein FlgK [Congregibacter sp.]|uniref:flagellar hook-associated protein FlgK n=1 Tax=Congregibacter sp. TaxID=2744308 RepID=UPI00385971D4
MADVLNIGTSALLSLQRAIGTTGNNIANVNTEGYSRQRVEFAALPPQLTGAGFVGTGVTIAAITRAFDQFLADDVIDRSSSAAGASTLADLSGRVDDILANPDTGLGPAIDDFFAALQDVATNPGSLPERQVLIGEAEGLAQRFQYLNDQFASLDQEANVRIDTSVQQINALAEGIADLNDRIVSETVRSGGQSPNDLLDSRDQLIARLSEQIGVTTVAQSDGAVNVLIGSGQALVVGSSSTQLETFTDPFDVRRLNVGISGLAVQSDIGRFLSGGELGAVLEFRGDILDGATTDLGLIATGLAATFNDQQALGLDLNGNFGGNFFRPLEPTTVPNISNTGNGVATASITDPVNLTGDEYRLRFDGTNYTLTNTTTNASSTGPGPAFSIDGVDISISGTPVAGDEFLIAPVAQGANLFDVAISDPLAFAAASPVRTSTSLGNAGSGVIDDAAVSSVANLPLGSNIVLTFNPDALGAGVPGFDVTGIAGGPIAYDPSTDANGVEATLGDISFTLSGIPVNGDSFTIENNVDGSGDNRNALALAELQNERTLNGGTATYQDAYAALLADVAVSTRQASNAAATESALLDQSRAALSSSQGVNLDEEAANLIRYQQAYQAAARVIAVADEVFQTLLNATGR